MKIKDIPKEERPREKLLEYGSNNLSNVELISIILKQGTKNNSVKDISCMLLNSIDDISNLEDITIEKLLEIKGIGQAQALTLLACIELGKRIFKNQRVKSKTTFKNSNDIYNYMKYLLDGKKQEYFYCLYVNTKKELIERKLLFMGTINRSTVHPREVFKNAYLCSASGIICVHNHPTGDINPSKEDIRFTNSLVELGTLAGIPILDHIITGNDNYYSFFNENKIIDL